MAPVLLEHLPRVASPLGVASIAVAGLVLLYLIERYVLDVPYPQGIPIIGQPEGSRRLSLRTRLRYHTDCEGLFREAYNDYVKKGKPVVIPGFGFRKEVIMPQSLMKWVLAQPDSVLNVEEAFVEVDQVRWGMGHEKFVSDAWQGMLVKTEMNQVLEAICAAMNNELGVVFDKHFGTDTANWKEIDLSSIIPIIIAQAASRFTVGLPLCRDEEYLRNCLNINEWFIINAGVTGGTPRILQPLVGLLINIPTRRLLWKMKKWFNPLWKQRLGLLSLDPKDPDHEEPQDHIQMILRYAQRERQHELHDFPTMLRRLAATNFGAMHQTKIQVTNLLLNVLGSDAEYNTIAVLRDEVDRILGDDKDAAWTKAKVNSMTRADSVSRETLRLQSFGGRAIFRKVLTSNVETPGGYHLPKNTLLSFLSQPAQTDEEKLDEATKYDPFRFSRMRELAESRNEKIAPVSLVSTSPEFLPFGHGKHACPGRFLIDFELKMILAYVLRNYDIAFAEEYDGKRPPNIWLTEAVLPPDGVKIRVKRRERSATSQ
ncbi:cytochrome P450 [Dactylonectria estremocensis]|uniref:Cytochrome P450 n=1 Tax=Dactylonectria estremocensis TaxID=1079267 RepID=A0A9P9JJ30_9HYPO|nr:cytochrome P450 [Dactylonectria estremocensis]